MKKRDIDPAVHAARSSISEHRWVRGISDAAADDRTQWRDPGHALRTALRYEAGRHVTREALSKLDLAMVEGRVAWWEARNP